MTFPCTVLSVTDDSSDPGMSMNKAAYVISKRPPCVVNALIQAALSLPVRMNKKVCPKTLNIRHVREHDPTPDSSTSSIDMISDLSLPHLATRYERVQFRP